jgi:hypothetical protein
MCVVRKLPYVITKTCFKKKAGGVEAEREDIAAGKIEMLTWKPESDTDVQKLTETKRMGSANCTLKDDEIVVA